MNKRLLFIPVLLLLMGAYRPQYEVYDTKEKIGDEMKNIENEIQPRQFVVYNTTPNLTDLQDHEFVVFSSGAVRVKFRDRNTIYTILTTSESAPSSPGSSGTGSRVVTLAGGGDVYLATQSFVPVPRAVFANRHTTFTTVAMSAYCIFPSTVGYTWFRIAKSTSNDVGTPWTYVSPILEVTTNAKYSDYISSEIVLNDREAFALHITSVPQLGILPSEFGIIIEGNSQ